MANTFYLFFDEYFATNDFQKRIFVGFFSSFILSLLIIFLLRMLKMLSLKSKILLILSSRKYLQLHFINSIYVYSVANCSFYLSLTNGIKKKKKEQKIIAELPTQN
jgi:hypothetical protein